jgi:hypothetical protein
MSLSVKEANAIIHGLSTPRKMPGTAYGIPARACKVGSALAKVPGSVCATCYANRPGSQYAQAGVQNAQEKRLKALQDPLWVDAMVRSLSGLHLNDPSRRVHRWHDSGDLQGVWHLTKIVDVARALPGWRFWLPTREYGIVISWLQEHGRDALPANLVIRLSAPMVGSIGHVATLAVKWDLCWSGVSESHGQPLPGSAECQAYRHGNECGSCRSCWDPSVRGVTYGWHGNAGSTYAKHGRDRLYTLRVLEG